MTERATVFTTRKGFVLAMLAGILGCCTVAWLQLPPVAFFPPGCLAVFGIMMLIVTAGENDR